MTPKQFYGHSNFKHNIKKIYDPLNIIQDKHPNVDVKKTTDIVGEKIKTKKNKKRGRESERGVAGVERN